MYRYFSHTIQTTYLSFLSLPQLSTIIDQYFRSEGLLTCYIDYISVNESTAIRLKLV